MQYCLQFYNKKKLHVFHLENIDLMCTQMYIWQSTHQPDIHIFVKFEEPREFYEMLCKHRRVQTCLHESFREVKPIHRHFEIEILANICRNIFFAMSFD